MSLTKEQLAFRSNGIGSSEISALCGLNPFMTALDVWNSKVFGTKKEPTLAMEAGNIFEKSIARFYTEVKDIQVSYIGDKTLVHTHPAFKFVRATPDFKREKEPWLLEIKNPGHRQSSRFGDDGSDIFPDHYRCQIHWQQALTYFENAELLAYFGGDDLRCYHVKRDRETEAALISVAERFWKDHVLKKVPPAHADAPDLERHVKARYPKSDGTMIEASDELVELIHRYASACASARDIAKDKELYEAEIKLLIGSSEGIQLPQWNKITYREEGRVNWKKIALELAHHYSVKDSFMKKMEEDHKTVFRKLYKSGSWFKGESGG